MLCVLRLAISLMACHDKRIARQELRIYVQAAQGGLRRVVVTPSEKVAEARRHLGGKSKRVQGADESAETVELFPIY